MAFMIRTAAKCQQRCGSPAALELSRKGGGGSPSTPGSGLLALRAFLPSGPPNHTAYRLSDGQCCAARTRSCLRSSSSTGDSGPAEIA